MTRTLVFLLPFLVALANCSPSERMSVPRSRAVVVARSGSITQFAVEISADAEASAAFTAIRVSCGCMKLDQWQRENWTPTSSGGRRIGTVSVMGKAGRQHIWVDWTNAATGQREVDTVLIETESELHMRMTVEDVVVRVVLGAVARTRLFVRGSPESRPTLKIDSDPSAMRVSTSPLRPPGILPKWEMDIVVSAGTGARIGDQTSIRVALASAGSDPAEALEISVEVVK